LYPAGGQTRRNGCRSSAPAAGGPGARTCVENPFGKRFHDADVLRQHLYAVPVRRCRRARCGPQSRGLSGGLWARRVAHRSSGEPALLQRHALDRPARPVAAVAGAAR
jgi:hypothetical protein